MADLRETRVNGEVLRRARVARNLSQRALARDVNLRLGQLVAMEKSGHSDRLTLGALYKLADSLCVEPASLLTQQTAVREPAPDDVAVEALLATVGKATNRDDIAWALGWDLERVNRALLALEQRLRASGQRLRRAKFGWFCLAAADDVLGVDQALNITRVTFSEHGITRDHARVLYRLAQGTRLSRTHTGRPSARRTRNSNPTGDLLRAGMLGIGEDGVFLTPEVAFSLCLDEVQTVAARALKPRTAIDGSRRRPTDESDSGTALRQPGAM